MTQKQKLRSLENKMEKIKNNYTEIDFEKSSRIFNVIRLFYELRQEHFNLKFEIEHCQTCGKKL